MLLVAEQLAVFRFAQHVGIGVDPRSIQIVQRDEVVAHFVAGIRQLQPDLLRALRNAAQADREAVAGQDGEYDAELTGRELSPYIRSDILYAHVVALGSCDHCFGHSDHVLVAQILTAVRCGQDAVGHDLDDVVALADDGRTNASGYGSDHSFHKTHASFGLCCVVQLQIIQRVVRRAVVAHLEVAVGAGGITGASHQCDILTLIYVFAHAD